MDHSRIQVSYNQDLQPLEKVLATVRRPGEFYASGSLEAPLPRVEVEGVGLLSFPVPGAQLAQLIAQAERAPYGRGARTIVDTNVRKVWQIQPSLVRISGRSWESTFGQILSQVTTGLGATEYPVTAELYKLLIYDEGGFFQAHRDTEKTGGMFGTLVVVLPSLHEGGDLVVRHGDREVVLDLSAVEVSELRFAAFYADCEHEVRPVTKGHRVCLIYNLVQGEAKSIKPLRAPSYDAEMERAADLLGKALGGSDPPVKLAWLLQHQYSPAGLSFDGLKGEDAALVKVLAAAGEKAGCVVHLAIVHIEESGPAEVAYEPRRSRWGRRYSRYDELEEETSEDVPFEVVEVASSFQYLDEWRDTSDRPKAYGRLPLAEGELLPNGALDQEKPDDQRVTEATGNEGASFERSYHRAALVLWPREQFTAVLLQAGVGAALPYLQESAAALTEPGAGESDRGKVLRLAAQIIAAWARISSYETYSSTEKPASRADMIQLLGQLGDASLMERFLTEVVLERYNGNENGALIEWAGILKPDLVAELLADWAAERLGPYPSSCVELLHGLVRRYASGSPAWKQALARVGRSIVKTLPDLKPDHVDAHQRWWEKAPAQKFDADLVVQLLSALEPLDDGALQQAACAALLKNTSVFDPGPVLVPALKTLHDEGGATRLLRQGYSQLWQHAAEWLLSRGEQPPSPPPNWSQEVKLSCRCPDCVELRTFAVDAERRVYRFKAAQARRQHLHSQIDQHGLDMTHITDRKGSPQTLVCTKTQRTYQRQCAQHAADIAALKTLAQMPCEGSKAAALCARIRAASQRHPVPPVPDA